jgi:uncharacterized protein (DUF1330 family)
MSNAKGYLYVELEVTHPEQFRSEYMRRALPVLEKFGARVLVASDSAEVLEGQRESGRTVLLEFESAERAREFYDSTDYQEIIKWRWSSASTRSYALLEGLRWTAREPDLPSSTS